MFLRGSPVIAVTWCIPKTPLFTGLSLLFSLTVAFTYNNDSF
jgi:hypothetical protein